MLFLAVVLVGVAFPGSLLGAAVLLAVWRATRPSLAMRLVLAVPTLATCAILGSWFAPGWLVSWFEAAIATGAHRVPLSIAGRSFLAETLLGPVVALTAQGGWALHRHTLLGYDVRRYERAMTRKKALEAGWQAPGTTGQDARAMAHPSGNIRLGIDSEMRQPFDLAMGEVAQHIFVPGASGTGKTTTLIRLADGALANGHGVVIVDCKGVGLGSHARALAERHCVPFVLVDPADRHSVGYDVCTGDAADVANKLIGAFTFGGDAEIYKQVAMEVVPLICRALVASRSEVSLQSMYDALGKGGLAQLGRRSGAEPYRDRLHDLEAAGGVGAAGYAGLQYRFGALMEGKFGDLFRKRPALDWDAVTAHPAVTYISLSSTAAGEDVELFARVITQDLKQLCDRRMRALDRGVDVAPVLVIYDEFAALREATQVVDLLLQARQARAPLVVATQYLPEEVAIRAPVLSAGVLVVHRLAHNDAEQIAKELGTHKVPFTTAQVDYDTGFSQKGSVRMVDEFNVHPNVLRTLPVGMAAVYSRPTDRRALVQVHRDTAEPNA